MKPAFEIMDLFYEDEQLIVAGLVFQDIQLDDKLHVKDQIYTIKDIIYFGHSLDMIERGMTVKLIVDRESTLDNFPADAKYAYLVTT